MAIHSADEALAASIYQQFVAGLGEHRLIRDPVERRVSLDRLRELQERARAIQSKLPEGSLLIGLQLILQRSPEELVLMNSPSSCLITGY